MSPLPVAGESPALSASCVTIGNFDGVHLGHQSLIRLAMAAAARDGLEFILLTFDPHPREVLFGKEKHFPLATREEKKRLLAALGIKKFLEIPFTRELASLSAEEFIASRLVPLNTRRLVAGHDFSLGKNREGGRARLEELGEKYGYKVSQAPALKIDGEIVSSTLLRDLIKRGDM
ncbi:MAG: FAD synthetase family protein, partial [Desulfovibrio sp.]|nr:FAD synthetase family protein [Desulfovibrio sp.]